jgi:hypothetical protein
MGPPPAQSRLSCAVAPKSRNGRTASAQVIFAAISRVLECASVQMHRAR